MKNLKVLIIVLLVMGCVSKEKKYSPLDWRSSMTALSQSLDSLLHRSATKKRFFDPNNSAAIKKELKTLVQISRDISWNQGKPDDDPLLVLSSQQMTHNLEEALDKFEAGDKSGAYFRVNKVSSYCVSCHTRMDYGRKNLNMNWSGEIKPMPAMRQAEYHYASRNYSNGHIAVVKALKTEKNLAPDVSQRLVVQGLSVATRVTKDPQKALELVDTLKSSSAPTYLRSYAKIWRNSVKRWAAEQPGLNKSSRSAKYKVGQQLIHRAYKQRNPLNGLVDYLRASEIFHSLITEGKKDKLYVNSIYYLGRTSKILSSVQLPGLYKSYFKECIEIRPETDLARQCFMELEESIFRQSVTSEKEQHELVLLKELAFGKERIMDINRRFDN